MRKLLFRLAIFSFALLLTVVSGQLIYFLHFHITYDDTYSLEPTDAILIFAGSRDRIEKGYQIAKQGISKNFVISPANESKLDKYRENFKPAPSVNFIIEDKARTTFENALYCSRIVQSNKFRSVTLVSSIYHLPRSYFLMKLMLFGMGVDVLPVGVSDNLDKKPIKVKVKYIYQEMVEFWGSLGEFVYYNPN